MDALAKSCPEKQDAVTIVYTSPSARALVAALIKTQDIPDLASYYKQGRLLTQGTTPSIILQELSTVVSCLQCRGKPRYSANWAPALAATAGILTDISRIFTVSHMTCEAAKIFVLDMNVRINYQQLLTAAHNRVAGVEVWVQAQQELGIMTDIPEIAVKICTGTLNYRKLTVYAAALKGDEDSLQLLLNSRSCSIQCYDPMIAELANQLLPSISDAAILAPMLLTAITRKHYEVLISALSLPTAHQLGSAAVLQLMQADVAVCREYVYYHRGYVTEGGTVMPQLAQLSAAAALSSTYVQSLINAAMLRRCHEAVAALCTLPAAAALGPDGLKALMQTALDTEYDCSSIVQVLAALPAAKTLGVEDLKALMQTAVVGGYASGSAMKVLAALPAAAVLKPEDVTHLMQTSLDNKCAIAIVALSPLPATKQLLLQDFIEMLKQAAAHKLSEAVVALCSLPAASEVHSEEVFLGIMSHMVTERPGFAAQQLCKLPAALTVAHSGIGNLLLTAVKAEAHNAAAALCALPASNSIPRTLIFQVVQELLGWVGATQSRSRVIIGNGTSTVHNALDVMRALGRLQNFQNLTATEFLRPLDTLMSSYSKASQANRRRSMLQPYAECPRHMTVQQLKTLCSCTAASNSSSALEELLPAALDFIRQDHEEFGNMVLDTLTQLPAAEQLAPDVFIKLVERAEQQGKEKQWVVQALMRLTHCPQMPVGAFQRLARSVRAKRRRQA